MITTRDLKVIEFIEEYKIARTSTIQQLFYPSLRVCQTRLKKLTEQGDLNRIRIDVNTEYLYFIQKPKQIKHSLLVTDFYRELSKQGKILHFKTEITLNNIRPDAVIGYNINGKNYIGLLEVEISNKGFDIQKYEQFNYAEFFPVMPIIYAVTNKPIPNTNLNIIRCDTNISWLKVFA